MSFRQFDPLLSIPEPYQSRMADLKHNSLSSSELG